MDTGIDTEQYVAAIEREGERLLEVADGSLDRPVPSCPDWDVAALVGHLGQVYGYVAQLVEACPPERPDHGAPPAPAEPEARLAWTRERWQDVLATLAVADPEASCWNWAGTGRAGFYHRRMAHETVLHRWDVEGAAGARTPIDTELAADGVDELVHVGMQYSSNPKKQYQYPPGSIHLHRTDGEGEWLLRNEDGRLVATREHAKGDVAVRGTGDNLLLYLWGRGGEDLEVFGDPELVRAWAAVAP